jgi:hypothetical protein
MIDRRQSGILVFVVVAMLTGAAGPALAGIAGTKWIPIGPAPEIGFFEGGVSGRATSIAVNPTNVDDVWLGTANGGVWHTTNAGIDWTPESDAMPPLAIGSLALDCTGGNCATIYVGTGENAVRRDTYSGGGILMGSIAGGHVTTWLPRGVFTFNRGSINNVVLDPTTSGSSKTIYVSLSSGVTASSTESTVTAPMPASGYGLYKSTDQGLNWTKLNLAGAAGARPTDLEMTPGNPSVLWAGFMGKGVFKSVNGGALWCPQNPGILPPRGCPVSTGLPDVSSQFDHVEIALWNSNIAYAMFGRCPDSLSVNCEPSIYRTFDGGVTWSQTNPGSTLGSDYVGCLTSYSRYTHALVVSPHNANTIFVGAIRLCRSDDGGATFEQSDGNMGTGSVTSPSWTGILHLDHHAIVFHPQDANRVYEVSDGGFAASMDGGANWFPRNDDLQTTLFQSLASSPVSTWVVGGLQDNGCAAWIGNPGWSSIGRCGDGGFTIVDRQVKSRVFATSNNGYGDALPGRLENGDITWIDSGLVPGEKRSYYPAFIQDPNVPPGPAPTGQLLYFGTNRLFRADSNDPVWQAVSPVLSSTSQPEILGGVNVITAIAVAPNDPQRIYIGYYGGEVFTTHAACTSPGCWQRIGQGIVPAAPVTRIAVDPSNPDAAYIAYSGFFFGAHAYKATLAGGVWSVTAAAGSGAGSLPPTIPVDTLSIEPSSPQIIWAGTDDGVFKTTDGGANWARFGTNLPRVPVYEIVLDETRHRVLAATHGRGVFMISQQTILTLVTWEKDFFNRTVPDTISVLGYGFLPSQACSMQIFRTNGSVCATSPSDANFGLILSDPNGTLTTTKALAYNTLPMAYACKNGLCIDGVFVAGCDSAANPLAGVRVTCGGQTATALINAPALAFNPQSAKLLLGQAPAPQGSAPQGAATPALTSARSFDVIVGLHAGGATQPLCSAPVSYDTAEAPETVLQRAADRINAEAECAAQGITASVTMEGLTGEDPTPTVFRLTLSAPQLQGEEMFPAFRTTSGLGSQQCLRFQDIGRLYENQLLGMRITLETGAGVSSGGVLSIVERSGLGDCGVAFTIPAGRTGADIAKALATSFQAPGIPGSNLFCPSRRNPRDVALDGDDSLLFSVASDITICNSDPGVGFTVGPKDLAICRGDIDCADASFCDGVERCDAGLCRPGSAPACDDGEACTLDACDEHAAACAHMPVTVDPVGDTVRATYSPATTTMVLDWVPVALADHSNTYRGSIPPGLMGQRPQPYDQACFESGDSAGDGAARSHDDAVPPIGWAWYYLVDGEGPCGEGGLGQASSGAPIPNTSPCPTPP